MNKAAVFLILALVSNGCQAISERAANESVQETALKDPRVAASIASDLSVDISPLLPQGSVLAFKPDEAQPLTAAFTQALSQLGYRIQDSSNEAGDAIQLQLWSAEVDGDLLVRLSSPSHHLSKIYRQSSSGPGQNGDPQTAGGVVPAGPVLVEATENGAST